MTSSYYPAPPRTTWRDSSLVRLLGSAISWFGFTLSFTLLLQAVFGLMAVGGSCASGGPYEIAVECPDSVALFAPLSIFMGLAAVGLGLFLSGGFGTPIATWAWPILFCGLGAMFLLAFFATGDPVGLIIGGVFEIMGLVPLVLEVRASVQRVILGQRSLMGTQFYEGERARRSMTSRLTPNPDGARRPTVLDWLLALAVTGVSGYLGYWVAAVWFAAVASAG
ncbi:MAG: hypothetical protein BGO97_06985 [Micrococcales bacterium 70-64]|nr:hypothetical protein [Leifsonia sp.]ODU63800.1 MAG: hypothetical protein ABT06_06990 [Leifsonia sp. SCN 70-46]OJX85491.1 MAG: hypothetical protein BGO97_06985 [Micrococcales bacterium 70-64]